MSVESVTVLGRLWSYGAELCDAVFASLDDKTCLALALTCRAAQDCMRLVLARREQQMKLQKKRAMLFSAAIDRFLRVAERDRTLLSQAETVRLASVSVVACKLVRRSMKRRKLSERRARLKELTVWRRSIVDWRVKYESPEMDKPLVDFGWIDFYDCDSGSFFICWDTAPLKREWSTLPCGNSNTHMLSSFELALCDCARFSSGNSTNLPATSCRFHGVD
eukprot:6181424-Pleurochrysis_carterae.AAC.1